MKNVIFILVFVSPPTLKIYILKWLCNAKIGKHAKIGWFSAISGHQIELGDYAELRSLSIIHCQGDVKIGAYTVISSMIIIYGAAGFRIGKHGYVGPQSLINTDENVSIGHNSALGPRCMIFTHGSFLPYTEGYWVKMAPVSVGDNVWIAAGVFIHAGITIEDHVFINSRSVVTKNIHQDQIVEGWPAKQVTTMDKIKRKMSSAQRDTAIWHIIQRFTDMKLDRVNGLVTEENKDRQIRFRYNNRDYYIILIASHGNVPNISNSSSSEYIFLINRPNWVPPTKLKKSFEIDFLTNKTCYSKNKIHCELLQFMRMYFGIKLEFH